MKQYQFKSNIACSGCIAKVGPFLNENPAIRQWKVDVTNPEKVLTVETENMAAVDIETIVAKAGFKAESLV
ncbi:MAG TPA: heavy-metal-associated domain-containing protein [Flavisolibacter sp.]|jgi:copper chaperone|nr:heavy-metal-associated domain-containing protein [Flavisolibacter sp.]